MSKHSKPVISTMINTTALLFTTFGGDLLIRAEYKQAIILVSFGFGLEFFKYWGMKKKLW